MASSRAVDVWHEARAADAARENLRVVCPRALEEPVDADAVRRTELLAAMGSLTPGQQEAVVLAFWGDMTAAEIAERAGVPLGTVKGRMRIGLQKMRRALVALR